jgi:hypothetical protein
MEWVPAVFIAFKLIVLGIGMFLAIKWHHDKAKSERGTESQRSVLWAAGKVVVVFVLLLSALLFLTLALGTKLGIDLTLP